MSIVYPNTENKTRLKAIQKIRQGKENEIRDKLWESGEYDPSEIDFIIDDLKDSL